MRILLLGGNGQLGHAFVEDGRLAARGKLFIATRQGNDLGRQDFASVDMASALSISALLNDIHPDVIVNAAAFTKVDAAEDDEATAIAVNATALGTIGRWAALNDALVVHFSTDYVFDGQSSTAYTEADATAPVNAYGRSKLAGERLLRESRAKHLILRTAWVYAAHGHNFLRTMLGLARERDELRIVADQYGAPTPVTVITSATIEALDHYLASKGSEGDALLGTYHLTCSGETTWHGFAVAIMEAATLNGLLASSPKVVPVSTLEYPTPARRPARSILDNRKFQSHFQCQLPSWLDCVKSTVNELSRIEAS
jgi:dTDP-4-dehydrorhamnose reductase